MKIRKKEHDKLDRRSRFEDIKLRVTHDVLQEYQNEKAVKQNLLNNNQKDEKTLQDEVNLLHMKEVEKKGEVDICQGSQVWRK